MSADLELLRRMFDAGVASASAPRCVPGFLPDPPRGRTVVVGAGKASASMAAVVEAGWDGPLSGLVVTRDGHGVPCDRIEVVEAAHPVPDDRGLAASARVLDLVRGAGEDDLVLCLWSGGGSALLASPAPGITLATVRELTSRLLRCGARISEINCVRKHLSAIHGGRLAVAAHPARVVTLAISDVPGDDLAVIASGPTVGDDTTAEEAVAILGRYGIAVAPEVEAVLRNCETPSPRDAAFARSEAHVIANADTALAAAAEVARAHGVEPVMLGGHLEGEARVLAATHAVRARATSGPRVLLSGGETTVTVEGEGRGGRNTEYALALAIELDGLPGVSALVADTDGIDGSGDNAGCVTTSDTLARAVRLGMDARTYLANNDAYSFFERLGDLVVTGPTRTNVNDFRAILIR